MRAIEINRHFVSQADWIDPARTVDKIIVGDPDAEIRRVLVTWISSFGALRAAAERGVDMLITHEPTFWKHADELENVESSEIGRAKKRFVDEHGLVILRNHDVWDRMPQVGIPWAWARFLGLGDTPAAVGPRGYQHRYDVDAVPLGEFARAMAARTATIGEACVQVRGDLDQPVSRIGVGTGCACSIGVYQEMGCDLSIVCDDGSCYWGPIQQAADMDHPVIRVNHGTSEEPGMATMTAYINEHLSGVAAEHLPHGSTFRLVGSL